MKHLLNEKWKGRYERQNGSLFCFFLYSSLFVIFPEGFSDGTWYEQSSSVTNGKMLAGYYLIVGLLGSDIVSGLLNTYRYRLRRRYPSGSEAFFDACASAVMLAISTVLHYIAGGFKYVVFPQYLVALIFPAFWVGRNIWWWYRAR